MSIEFALRFRETPFGLLSEPLIPIFVQTPTGDREFWFLLDSGAEFALAPRRLALDAGLNWDGMSSARVVGVEQGSIPARLGRLPIRIGSAKLSVRCLFAESPRTPFVLGRADFFDAFIVTFDQPQRKITLTEEASVRRSVRR